MENTLLALISALGAPALLSGLFLWWLTRRDNRLQLRQADRSRETVLVLRGLMTIGALAGATARALKDGHANGGVGEALDGYAAYREELTTFLAVQSAAKNRR